MDLAGFEFINYFPRWIGFSIDIIIKNDKIHDYVTKKFYKAFLCLGFFEIRKLRELL